MHNPWKSYRVTGTWADHASYSAGGTDYPLPYGTVLTAPASGRLVVNGWVGTAGRRATLYFDRPVARVVPASETRMAGGYVEHDCDAVAIVYQHASSYLKDNEHYDEGATVGYSGASASGLDWGGDVHLHTHLLCEHGERLDWLKFQSTSQPAGRETGTILEEDTMTVVIVDYGTAKPYPGKHKFRIGEEALRYLPQEADAEANAELDGPQISIDAVEFTRVCAARGIPIGQNGEPNVPVILLANGKTGKGATFWSRARSNADTLARIVKKLGA